MKYRSVLIIICIAALSCTKPGNTDTPATPAPDSLATVQQHANIDYWWPALYEEKSQFEPFNKLYQQVQQAIHLKDSLGFKDGGMTAADSVVANEAFDKLYQSIIDYSKQVTPGIKVEKGKSAVRPDSVLRGKDESHSLIPVSTSTTLDKIDFTFLGGAPFVYQNEYVIKDANGNPESQYTINVSENSEYFFNYVYSRQPVPMEISYGPPLSAYDGPKFGINGVGSITHHLSNRIPVLFLTSNGTVPATLISVNMKLTDEYGCVSSYPTYVFGCVENLNPSAIFGVIYSDNRSSFENAESLYDPNSPAWSYDLDGDGNIDLVRIQSTTSGASSDELGVAIWFAHINNKWVVIDYASQPDCT
ncbi:MAG: hypothetical protein WDO14_08715 [Bacteroidota bacterium]